MKRLALGLGLLMPLWAQALTVSAAASLADAFQALAPRFEARHPGVRLRFNFGASGALLQQIAKGAPVDVVASADAETLDRAAAHLLPGTRRDFAANALLLVTPAQAPGLARVGDLALPTVRRIAVGKPASVPAGRYAQQLLQGLRLWEPLQPKLVFGDNVRQVLDYVARGEVDAGFVYRSDAQRLPAQLRVAWVATGHAPIRYPVAVVRHSTQLAQAQAFIDYLQGAEAQALLRQHGFQAP